MAEIFVISGDHPVLTAPQWAGVQVALYTGDVPETEENETIRRMVDRDFDVTCVRVVALDPRPDGYTGPEPFYWPKEDLIRVN